MSKRTPKLYFQDILDSIKKIENYLQGCIYKRFVTDEMVLDAVVRNIEIIGEAALQMPLETKKIHPEIPWVKITGMRNKIVHEYFGVDVEILWQTIKEDLPKLKRQIESASRV